VSEHDLLALGFEQYADGVLHAPSGSRITLAPIGQSYELRISLGDANAVVAVQGKAAVKITRGETVTDN
jgi:hypothetical protein